MQYEDDFELVLSKPIELGGTSYSTIQLSEPTADQLVKSGKAGTSMEQLVCLINLNGMVPLGVVNRMRQRDLQRAADFFGHFGEETPSTSETSSPS